MDDQNTCELLSKLFTVSKSIGMVGVPSGVVTQDDMDRADDAAMGFHPTTPVNLLKRKCFVLSGGDPVQNPKGMQASRLESVWVFAKVNAAALLELLEKCDQMP